MKIIKVVRSCLWAGVFCGVSGAFGSDLNEIENGDFETLITSVDDASKERYSQWGWTFGNDPILLPTGWSLHDAHPGKLSIVEENVHSGINACQIDNGWIHYLFPVVSGDNLEIQIWARGEGSIEVMLFQYEEAPEGGHRPLETEVLPKIVLSGEWEKHTFSVPVTLPSVARMALAFGVNGTAVVDDVVVKKVEK